MHRDAVVLAGPMGDRRRDVVTQLNQGLSGPKTRGLEAERDNPQQTNPSSSGANHNFSRLC